MATRLSTFFLRTLREDPVDAEVASHKLLVRAGYIRRAAPGVYTWLPLGLKVLNKVENIVREEMNAIGAQEVHFPALLPREPYEATNRWEEYGDNLFRLQDRKGTDMLLAPTHEEMFTLLVKDLYSSYKDLPVCLYQIQTKYRDEARPRAGLLRGREFIMKDSYSFNVDDEGLAEAYEAHRAAYQKIFERLGLEIVIVKAQSGAMGGSRSEEFLHPTAIGEDTFVRSAGGYAANVEAVTTVVPEPVDASNTPAYQVLETPESPTIETLVDQSNALHPREDRAWTAADTLKNVVVAVVLPDGERKLVAIGVPGDRAVDLGRVEVNVGALLGVGGEVEVEQATEEDFNKINSKRIHEINNELNRNEQINTLVGELVAQENIISDEDVVNIRDEELLHEWNNRAKQVGLEDIYDLVYYKSLKQEVIEQLKNEIVQLEENPLLVKGYIGPGLTLDAPLLGEESATGIPYYLDPRVVEGSDWITGANEHGKHVYYLVNGRDFKADGVIEACEVREGDPAPDGSGPLEAARGIEMGHIFQLGRKYAEALDLKVLDQNGKLQTVTMGSYGIGVTRALAAIAEKNHDDKGLIWPRNLAPADVHVVVTGKGDELFAAADELVAELEAQGLEVIIDDRPKASPGVKFGDAELLGVPTIVVFGRGYKDGKLELKDRRTGEARDIDVATAVADIIAEVRG